DGIRDPLVTGVQTCALPISRIAFAVVPCALGRLLVAATAGGICRISLGDDADALERGLAAEFPAATIARDDDTLRHWVAEITARSEERRVGKEWSEARDAPT